MSKWKWEVPGRGNIFASVGASDSARASAIAGASARGSASARASAGAGDCRFAPSDDILEIRVLKQQTIVVKEVTYFDKVKLNWLNLVMKCCDLSMWFVS